MQRRRVALPSILFVVSLATSSRASSPPSSTLSAGVDTGFRSARDDLVVPRASSGPSLGGAARFLATWGPGLVDTGLRFEVAALFDRDGHPAAAISHALRLGYLPIVFARPDAWSFAVGPLLAWDTDVLWLAKWDDAHAYWMGRRYLAVATRAWRKLSPALRLDLSAEASLVGFESRPPAYRFQDEDALTHVGFYFAGVNRDAKLGWLADWQAVRVEADLAKTSIARGTPHGASLGLEARLAHTDMPAQAFVFELSLRAAYAWDLR